MPNNRKTGNHLQFPTICKSAKPFRNHVFHKLSNFYKSSNIHFPSEKCFTQEMFSVQENQKQKIIFSCTNVQPLKRFQYPEIMSCSNFVIDQKFK